MLRSTETVADVRILAQAIVNTIPEPFVVLDEKFRLLEPARARQLRKTLGIVNIALVNMRCQYALGMASADAIDRNFAFLQAMIEEGR